MVEEIQEGDENYDPEWTKTQMNGREAWIPQGYIKVISKVFFLSFFFSHQKE